MAVWASTLGLQLPVKIQVISFTEVIIDFRGILLTWKIACFLVLGLSFNQKKIASYHSQL